MVQHCRIVCFLDPALSCDRRAVTSSTRPGQVNSTFIYRLYCGLFQGILLLSFVIILIIRFSCTLRYDTIRYDTIRHDTTRHDTTDTIRYDTIRYDTIRYDNIRYDTIRYDTIRYDTIRYDTIRYDTIRYDTIRYDTIRYDTIRETVTQVAKLLTTLR